MSPPAAARRPWAIALLLALAIEGPRMAAAFDLQRRSEAMARLGLGHGVDATSAFAIAGVLGFVAILAMLYVERRDVVAKLAVFVVLAHGLASTIARLRSDDRYAPSRDLVERVERPEGSAWRGLLDGRLSWAWLLIELVLPLVAVIYVYWLVRRPSERRGTVTNIVTTLVSATAIVACTWLAAADELAVVAACIAIAGIVDLRSRPIIALSCAVVALFEVTLGVELASGWKRTRALCVAATMTRSYSPDDRRRLLSRARERLRSPLGRLVEDVGKHVAPICDTAEDRQ